MTKTATTKAFQLTGPINLSVRLGRGSVTIRTVDDATTATVELRTEPGNEPLLAGFTTEMVGRTLTIAAPREGGIADLASLWRARPREGVAVMVTVPTGTATKIATSSASITVTGRCGGADITTGSGAIRLDHVDGDLLLSYASAESRTARVSGSVTVRSGSGDAQFGIIEGSLEHVCASGLLEVGEVRGAVRSRSGSGSARLAAVYGDVDFASGSGGISIGLPAGAAAHLNVTTGSGQVRSELAIEDHPAPAKATINVRARTGSGDVQLFRAA
jgi:hypothetical protein